jgi:hypothetical protein
VSSVTLADLAGEMGRVLTPLSERYWKRDSGREADCPDSPLSVTMRDQRHVRILKREPARRKGAVLVRNGRSPRETMALGHFHSLTGLDPGLKAPPTDLLRSQDWRPVMAELPLIPYSERSGQSHRLVRTVSKGGRTGGRWISPSLPRTSPVLPSFPLPILSRQERDGQAAALLARAVLDQVTVDVEGAAAPR